MGQHRMTIVSFVCIFVLGGQRGTLPEQHVVEQFDEVHCRTRDHGIVYRLYCPNLPGPWPLVVWFHGRGEAGNDNQQQLAWLELMLDPPDRPFPACVVALQRPSNSPRWLTHRPDSEDAFVLLDKVLADVMAAHAIDRDRVILCGISSGATAVWAYAQRHPHRFSALAPLATTVVPAKLEGLTSIPIWAFQSTTDGATSVGSVGQFIDRIRQQGGPARLTIIQSQTHDCWTQAFKVHGLREWMISQFRQNPSVAFSPVPADSQFWDSCLRGKSCCLIVLSGCLLLIVFVGCLTMRGFRPVLRGRFSPSQER